MIPFIINAHVYGFSKLLLPLFECQYCKYDASIDYTYLEAMQLQVPFHVGLDITPTVNRAIEPPITFTKRSSPVSDAVVYFSFHKQVRLVN